MPNIKLFATSSLLLFTLAAFAQTTADESRVIFLSNSHLDTQWNWDAETTINEYIPNTLNENFALFEKYPDFQFNFEGAIHYMWMKEYYPEEYEKLKEYVASGQWHISGGSINANDVMIPSAESLIRNFLYGQQFYKEEFSVRGGYDIMLPDCFGFPYSLPTIGKHCGVTGFHTQKLTWGFYDLSLLPPYGIWQGVDGSQIYAIFKGGDYDAHEDFNKDMSYDNDMLSVAQDNYNNYGVAAAIRYVGPRGDQGGALRDESYTSGENTPYWLQQSMNSNGSLQVSMWSPDEIFDYLATHDNDKYQVWNDELPLTTHATGCYTSQAILKYWNRKGELLADAAEKSSVAASWVGAMQYPQAEINEAWIKLLWHQHHDDLPGTSIPMAYENTYDDLVIINKALGKSLTSSVGAFARQMDTQVEGVPILIYNPLSIERTDVVEATIASSSNVSSIRVLNEDGEEVLSQVTGYDPVDGTLSFLFKATVQSLGYAAYEVRLNETSQLTSTLAVTETTLENDKYLVTVDAATGDVSSIMDKTANQELLYTPIRMYTLDNVSLIWPSWEISYETLQGSRTYVDNNVTVSIAESGPLRVRLKVTRTLDNSSYVQYIQLQDSEACGRVDFVNEIDWKDKGKLLKVEFPTALSNREATYDMSIGTIVRENNTTSLYEVPAHQWVDLTSSRGYGVSILNDCKYGWDKPNNYTMQLTLIHTPITENYSHQADQDLGLNKFTYSIYGHTDEWDERTQWEASRLNQPMLAFEVPKYDGELGKEFSFASLNTDKVAIKALKKAEESDEIIVRVYELVGDSHDNVEITFPAEILSAREVNGVEESVGSATSSGNKLSFNISKYQPKTFAVQLAASGVTTTLPSSQPVENISFNRDMMSYNSNRSDISTTLSVSYPAELISDTIWSDGIPFVMGSREDTYKNSYQCLNSDVTISFPAMDGAKKLYILAASSNSDGTTAAFTVDGKSYTCNVPYWGEIVGAWDTEFNLGGGYCDENVAFTATHHHSITSDEYVSFMHMYKYALPCDDATTELLIAENSDLFFFAVTLSDNENDDIVALSDITCYPTYEDLEDSNMGCSDKIVPISVTASSYVNSNESPEYAIDDDATTKWCATNSYSHWLELTFAEEMNICSWLVLNAGKEGDGYVTSALCLQTYEDGMWIDIDAVSGNTDNKVIRNVETFTTTRVRLQVTQGEQDGYTARIYEFEVYGEPESEASAEQKTLLEERDFYLKGAYPNPSDGETSILCMIPEGVSQCVLYIYDSQGRLVAKQANSVQEGMQSISWNSAGYAQGIYQYFIAAQQNGRVICTNAKRLVVSRP